MDKSKINPTVKIRILVEKEIAHYLSYERKHYGFVRENEVDGEVEMTFISCATLEGFSRWYMMFGDHATILEPDQLKTRVLELLELNKQRLL